MSDIYLPRAKMGLVEAGTTQDPSWGCPRSVLGAIDSFLEPFFQLFGGGI